MAVVDSTGTEGLYDIDFSFEPENNESFKVAMASLGLTYRIDLLKTDVLILKLKGNK